MTEWSAAAHLERAERVGWAEVGWLGCLNDAKALRPLWSLYIERSGLFRVKYFLFCENSRIMDSLSWAPSKAASGSFPTTFLECIGTKAIIPYQLEATQGLTEFLREDAFAQQLMVDGELYRGSS